jgi:hypothetical protein
MNSSLQGIVALCAGAGFLIVWLVFPSKKTQASFQSNDQQSAGSSSSPPPEDEPEPESAYEEPPEAQSTGSRSRPRWCDILLLEPDATPDAIRKAYARLMKGLHPDIAGADEHTTRQCALVQDAYRQAMQDRRAQA